MAVYYILWGITSILSFIEVYIDKNRSFRAKLLRICIIGLLWCIFVFLVGFKGEVGTDYLSYQKMYEASNAAYVFSANSVEPLFWAWMKVCSYLSFSFPMFWFVTALCNISLKFYIFRKISPFVALSILIYIVGLFFERDFDGIRQGISIGLCYLACIQYIERKSVIEYSFTLICAFLIHYTAILFFFIPLLCKIRINKKIIGLLLIIGLICIQTHFNVMEFVFDNIGMDNMLYDKLYSYMTSDVYAREVGINIGLIFRIVILFLFIKYEKALNIDNSLYNLLKNGFFISIFLSLIFNNFDILSHRLGYGFREFQIFIIPYLVVAAKGIKNKLIVTSLIAVYSLVLLMRLLSTPHLMDSYIYKTIF